MEDSIGFTMGSMTFTRNRIIHSLKWAMIWVVAIASLTSCGHVIRPSNATAPAEATRLEPVAVSASLVTTKQSSYTVTTSAANVDIGETFSVVPLVERVEPGTPDPLLLGVPIATPTGVEPGKPTTVIFRAQIDGTSAAPEVLFLDELDHAGKPLELAVAVLRDEGESVDTLARDQIYSGTFEIDRPASELRFRVRAAYFGEEVVSGGTPFLVTPFPRQARPSDPDLLVPMTGTPSRVFANEVEIKTIPGVSPNDLKEIAASIDGTVVGVIPPLHIYLIEFPGDGSARDVREAIATLSTYSQVESATPNFEVVYNGISFNSGTDCEPTASDCPNDGNHPDQWYLDKIGARQAWEIAGGGSSDAKVAIIDGRINCDQGDLEGRCMAMGSNEHATQVAGIIAANANNGTGIAGIAWNTELESITAGRGGGSTFTSAMLTMMPEVKIINISWRVLLNDATAIGHLRDGVCHAVDAGKLVVVAAGNLLDDSDEGLLYPARLNNETSYKCPSSGRLMEKHLLVVGGSDKNDGRATWTEQGLQDPFFSSDASYLDIYAPGVSIRTISQRPSGVTTVNGTSFATALVSGAAAVLWAHDTFATPPGETRAKAVHDQLITSGDPVSTTWNATCVGEGGAGSVGCKRLNLAAAVTFPAGPESPTGVTVSQRPNLPGSIIFGEPLFPGSAYVVLGKPSEN